MRTMTCSKGMARQDRPFLTPSRVYEEKIGFFDRAGTLPKEDPWSEMASFPPLSKAYSTGGAAADELEDCRKTRPSDDGQPTFLLAGTDQGSLLQS
jgi:hypothetical protein